MAPKSDLILKYSPVFMFRWESTSSVPYLLVSAQTRLFLSVRDSGVMGSFIE